VEPDIKGLSGSCKKHTYYILDVDYVIRHLSESACWMPATVSVEYTRLSGDSSVPDKGHGGGLSEPERLTSKACSLPMKSCLFVLRGGTQGHVCGKMDNKEDPNIDWKPRRVAASGGIPQFRRSKPHPDLVLQRRVTC
jgi:hypothetical protein